MAGEATDGFFVQVLGYLGHETIVVREVALRFGTFKKAEVCAEVMYASDMRPYGVRVVDGAKETLWERNLSNDFLHPKKSVIR